MRRMLMLFVASVLECVEQQQTYPRSFTRESHFAAVTPQLN